MKNSTKLMAGLAFVSAMALNAVAHADTVVLQDQNRDVVREWVYDNNHGCPAGTVATEKTRYFGLVHSQHNCVIPKGENVTVYQPGTVIPSTVTYTQLPSTVTTQLPSAPAGDVYVTSDTGMYLINPQTRTVVDTINLYDQE